MPAISPSGSSEWRRFAEGSVERNILLALGAALGVELRPRTLVLTQESRVEVEGMDVDGRIVVQLVANLGGYKAAYRNKVMADMFKLLWLRDGIPSVERAVLVVSPVTARALSGWVGVAAKDLGVEVVVFDGSVISELGRQS